MKVERITFPSAGSDRPALQLTAGPRPEDWPQYIDCPECGTRIDIHYKDEDGSAFLWSHDYPGPSGSMCILSMIPVFKDIEAGQRRLV